MSARRTVAAALVAGATLTGVAFAALERETSLVPAGAAVATVTVDRHALGRVVPPSFLGFSIEWDSVLPYTGPAGRRRADLLRLLAPIRRAAGSPLALRIGGDTGDQAWWNPAHRPRPPTVLQDVGPATMDAIAWLARGLGGPVTLGLNLALGDPANARAMARAAARRLPPGALHGLEIGNEPDLYSRARTFRRGGHVHRRLSKYPHYSSAVYARQASRYLATLATAGLRPAPRLVVGGFASAGWWRVLPRMLHAWRGRAGEVAAHLYALSDCQAPTPPVSWLTSAAASRDRVAALRPIAAIAREAGLPLRVAELNSAACGGRRHWSDTSAGALWLTDTLFAMVRLGVAETDVHTWRGALYAPFAVTDNGVRAHAPLAGMLAFARGAPAGSRLARTAVRGGDGTVRAWATVDAAGRTRVVLLAADGAHATVAAAGGSGCAAVWRPGRRRGACVCPTRGRYAVRLGPSGLAVMTIAAPGTPATACRSRHTSHERHRKTAYTFGSGTRRATASAWRR